MQPCRNSSKRPYRVVGRRRRRGRLKTASINVNQVQKVEKTYRQCVHAIWSTWRPIKGIRRTKELTFESRMPGEHWREDGRLEIERISVNQVGEGETTYRGRACIAQPPGNNSKRCHRVIGPIRQCARIKSQSTNVSRTGNGGSAYLKCVLAIRSIQRPKKDKRRLDGLTFESRIPGEGWHDVEDHG